MEGVDKRVWRWREGKRAYSSTSKQGKGRQTQARGTARNQLQHAWKRREIMRAVTSAVLAQALVTAAAYSWLSRLQAHRSWNAPSSITYTPGRHQNLQHVACRLDTRGCCSRSLANQCKLSISPDSASSRHSVFLPPPLLPSSQPLSPLQPPPPCASRIPQRADTKVLTHPRQNRQAAAGARLSLVWRREGKMLRLQSGLSGPG